MARLPESDERLQYSIALMIKHPSLNPTTISQELGIIPDYSWNVGDARKTPVGTPLPGQYPHSYWACSKKVYGEIYFFESVIEMLGHLEAASDFIRGVADGGGTTSINVGLFGGQNIGDVIGWLGIEVLPKMN